jgi:hypothetical protein
MCSGVGGVTAQQAGRTAEAGADALPKMGDVKRRDPA